MWKFENEKKMKHILYFLSLLLIPVLAFSQDWVVPTDKKQQVAPYVFTDATRKAGEDLFNKNCASCHGNPGKSNFIKLVPSPGDPAAAKYQSNSDGEIFYKMSEGRGPMPSFKNAIDPDQRWQIISYIRSFNSGYKQPEPISTATSAINGKVRVGIKFNVENKELIVSLKQQDGEIQKPIVGTQVMVFAVRYFGNLTIDEQHLSNDEGQAFFKIPNNLPGDSVGNVLFRIKISNEAANLSLQKDTLLKAGVIGHRENMRDHQAMWNKRSMAPSWLIISYLVVVLVVWGTIMFILILLKKIKEKGDEQAD